ncbi:MAG: TetR/AcrR family transcriptional regulator [Tenericutes bacterium]|nr:TetR/AcrR family transcriptional regulator [Mycoplasmatota bacterium]
MVELNNQKEIIYKAALEIILSEDIQKFSIRMISKRCNIGIGTIYKYYGNKNDILVDITRDFWISYITFIKENVNQSYGFLERIEFYHKELVTYSKRFNYLILSKELSSSFRKVGKAHHNNAQTIFQSIIINDSLTTLNIDPNEATILADFICNNLVSLITMETYKFETFYNILKKLLTTL